MATNGGRLSGVTVFVTGGSAGIGAGCVRILHDDGAQVAFCSNAPSEGRSLEAQLGPRALFLEADCRVESQLAAAISAAVARFGGLDCLVNNVGSHPPDGPIDDFSADDFRSLFELNVVSPFVTTKLALPHLRRSQKSPSIVNISSMSGPLGQLHSATYSATKGAVAAMTKALAIDEAQHGVRVNCIMPSATDTPLVRRNIQENMTPEQRKMPEEAVVAEFKMVTAKLHLLGRLGTPEDVGRACAFLASKDAEFITGIDLHVSGGVEVGFGVKLMPNKVNE